MVADFDSPRRASSKYTVSLKPREVEKRWILLDAEGAVLGRLASFIALRLRGKHRPDYTPHVDMGDAIVVVNASKIVLTGEKTNQKLYHWHTGHIGGIKSRTAGTLLEGRFPERVLGRAVRGMLPDGPLGSTQFGNLRIYPGPDHPHVAQQPQQLDFSALNGKNIQGGPRVARQPLTDEIVAAVKGAVRPEVDASIARAADRLENSFNRGLSEVRIEIATVSRNVSAFVERADQQLEVQQKELAELRKFNENVAAQRAEQRDEMRQLREMIGSLVAKLDPG